MQMMNVPGDRFHSALRSLRNAAGWLAIVGFATVTPLARAQTKSPAPAPKPAPAQWQEMRAQWRSIGRKLVAMAEDFPEDKYDFKAQKDQRTFAENLLHVAGDDYRFLSAVKGENMAPQLPARGDPQRSQFKTKADVVNLMKQVVADGDALLQAQGDAGLQRQVKYPYAANQLVHAWFCWSNAIEHSGEHYGQLVVYYRVNGMVPPASRPRPKQPAAKS
jgi:uncharacterized damage-inducible protein DinB